MQYVYPAVPDVCIRPIDKLFLWKKKKAHQVQSSE